MYCMWSCGWMYDIIHLLCFCFIFIRPSALSLLKLLYRCDLTATTSEIFSRWKRTFTTHSQATGKYFILKGALRNFRDQFIKSSWWPSKCRKWQSRDSSLVSDGRGLIWDSDVKTWCLLETCTWATYSHLWKVVSLALFTQE